ncbi:hypothetical protein [Paenibacillus polymyxa]|uniref:hypothetical protein n=1 Tax=Paenibacillus polymyxa TaxID=1406 RepID=UPI001E3FAFC7|nr:hypothetical protein [Paenibacillus polymyxa]
MSKAKDNGLTEEELIEVITHLAFMRAGRRRCPLLQWPKNYSQKKTKSQSKHFISNLRTSIKQFKLERMFILYVQYSR